MPSQTVKTFFIFLMFFLISTSLAAQTPEAKNQILGLGYEVSGFGRASGYTLTFFPENFNLGILYTYFGSATVNQSSQNTTKIKIDSTSVHLAWRISEIKNTTTYIAYGIGRAGDLGINQNPSFFEMLLPFTNWKTVESNYNEILLGVAGTQRQSFNWQICLGYRWGTKNDVTVEPVSGITFGLGFFYNL